MDPATLKVLLHMTPEALQWLIRLFVVTLRLVAAAHPGFWS